MDLPESLAVKPNIPPSEQTDQQLRDERAYWLAQIDTATGWGAAIGAAHEFYKACDEELRRRGL